MKLKISILAALAAATAAPVLASDLSYTYIDFRVLGVSTDASGTATPVPGQTVAVETGDGDGISVAGAVALPGRFYALGSYNSSIVDVSATITSPLTVAMVEDEFDLITTTFGFGYQYEIAENLDVLGELTYESAEFDFGSLAGEDFDFDDGGAAVRVGFRFNPSPPIEMYAMVGTSPVGEVLLDERRFDSATVVNAGMRWYFFPDLGVGLDYQSGDIETLTLSMRFSFGTLPW